LYKHVLVAGKAGYKISSIRACFNRVGFYLNSFKHRKLLKLFINEIDKLGFIELFKHEMPLLVVTHCPYIHNQWEVEQRFKVILQHYKIIKKMPSILNLVDAKPRIILDLSKYLTGMFITLDKAKWFVREGEIVLNLFKEDQRLMSLAFTFSTLNNELVIYIGAMQGRLPSNETLEMLKEVTKSLEGLRPADLLLEVLRAIALNVGVKKILAISDEHRHHRHKYFGKIQQQLLKTNYNEKWIENQGQLLDNGFYALPIKKHRKDIAEIASNKRALYRRRYEMLDILEGAVKKVLSNNVAPLQSFELEFPITVQQKVIDLNPEKTVLAKAMFDTANYQIRFGEFAAAKKTLHTLIKQYPSLDIKQSAEKRLNALEIVKAIEGASKNKSHKMTRKNRLKPDNTNNKI
jgi:uncharacterized protein VirK/YbjX